jgi:hypothetical protein
VVERIFERENIDGAMVPRCAGVHAADGEDGLRVGIMARDVRARADMHAYWMLPSWRVRWRSIVLIPIRVCPSRGPVMGEREGLDSPGEPSPTLKLEE